MDRPHAICISIPSAAGERWVFVVSPMVDLELNRQFRDYIAARAYAVALHRITGWPVEDHNVSTPDQAEPFTLDAYERDVNEILWLMTTLADESGMDFGDREFWADAARQQAEVIVATGNALSQTNLAVALAVGAAMLRRAALDLGLASVDDVLARIMVTGGEQ